MTLPVQSGAGTVTDQLHPMLRLPFAEGDLSKRGIAPIGHFPAETVLVSSFVPLTWRTDDGISIPAFVPLGVIARLLRMAIWARTLSPENPRESLFVLPVRKETQFGGNINHRMLARHAACLQLVAKKFDTVLGEKPSNPRIATLLDTELIGDAYQCSSFAEANLELAEAVLLHSSNTEALLRILTAFYRADGKYSFEEGRQQDLPYGLGFVYEPPMVNLFGEQCHPIVVAGNEQRAGRVNLYNNDLSETDLDSQIPLVEHASDLGKLHGLSSLVAMIQMFVIFAPQCIDPEALRAESRSRASIGSLRGVKSLSGEHLKYAATARELVLSSLKEIIPILGVSLNEASKRAATIERALSASR